MNDITALMQRLELATAKGCCHTLLPDDCRALVEALEKAQRQNEYLREQSAEWERKAISNFQECATMSERIYLLESRTVTVKLPAAEKWRKPDAVRAQNAYRILVVNELTAAGIQVIEGEQQ